jgi:hypothetical protein
MIIDGNLLFDSAAAITSSANSTNTIDLANFRDLGVDGGEYAVPKLMVLVNTAFTTGGGATLQVNFQGSTDNSTWTTYASSPVYAAAALTAGARLFDIDMPRPPAGVAIPRYVRLSYTVGTSTFSAGAVTSALVMQRQDTPVSTAGYQSGYPSGFTVSN